MQPLNPVLPARQTKLNRRYQTLGCRPLNLADSYLLRAKQTLFFTIHETLAKDYGGERHRSCQAFLPVVPISIFKLPLGYKSSWVNGDAQNIVSSISQTTGNFCMRHSADQSSVPKSHCLFKSNPHLPEFHHYTYPEATAGNALPFSTSSKKFFITEQSLITTVLRRMKKKALTSKQNLSFLWSTVGF